MLGEKLRPEFPVLSRRIGCSEHPLIYLDSAATSLKPSRVIEAVNDYERNRCANIHRGIHTLAEESTEMFEQGRKQLAAFLGVTPDTLVFTQGTTESINIVSHGWEPVLCASASILVDESNHHANIVPWQMLADEYGADVSFLPVTTCGQFDKEDFYQALARHPTLIALTHISNVTGLVAPIKTLTDAAHTAGTAVLLDCAQSFGHIPLDLTALGVDFAMGSVHKAYGPFGLGFLWCCPEEFRRLRPLVGGGGMISRVTAEGFVPTEGVALFEGGTPNISAVAGMREALGFMFDLGLDTIARHVAGITEAAVAGLIGIEGVSLIGSADLPRSSLVSFKVSGSHTHDVAAFLDTKGIAVRAGHHCAMPLHEALNHTSSVRASFAAYSTKEDVEAFLSAVRELSVRRKDAGIYRNRR
ncbi:MAG: cysteine desulfurase [Coriobacteriales bacterium]|jgi:cysteine desulfurase/selenocysteine lyase|nr:cysteine desulfurase [Coriobacteriales bacterium]